MSKYQGWQCRNCGEKPRVFVGDVPSTARCIKGGNHVWMKVPEGKPESKYWQCMHCGAHPTVFVGNRPDNGKCKITGNKHVWILL